MKHPDFCYVFLQTEKAVGIVKWGEKGYYTTNYPHNYTEELVDEINTSLGVAKHESSAMIACSMSDSLPETDEAWREHYESCLELFTAKNKK